MEHAVSTSMTTTTFLAYTTKKKKVSIISHVAVVRQTWALEPNEKITSVGVKE
jgi:hypothetical protein